jgi:cytoskeletal protein CcmA (bactofilin family)
VSGVPGLPLVLVLGADSIALVEFSFEPVSLESEITETGECPMSAPMTAPMTAPAGGLAQIGKSVVIKGELSGSEDLYLDGQVEGSIALKGNSLTVGPNGQVRGSVEAKGVVVQGKLDGNVQASDRVELRKSAIVTGDIATQRISIEEGAYLKGKVDIHRADAK